jgi:hypothetical protein
MMAQYETSKEEYEDHDWYCGMPVPHILSLSHADRDAAENGTTIVYLVKKKAKYAILAYNIFVQRYGAVTLNVSTPRVWAVRVPKKSIERCL